MEKKHQLIKRLNIYMRFTFLKTFIFILLLFFNISVNAQFRKYANEFLNIGVGAKGLAMGGAMSAIVDDGTAGYWNPAGLVNVKDNVQFNLMHASYFAGIGTYDFANVSMPTSNRKGVIGLTGVRFGIDDIPNTLYLVEPDGSINYNNIKSFSSADYGFLISYAQNVAKNSNTDINFGINTKVIHRTVGSFAKAWGFGLDAGLQIKKGAWQFGVVGKDISTTFNTWAFTFSDQEKEALYLAKNQIPVKSTELTSPRLTVSAARKFSINNASKITAATDFDVNFDGKRNTVINVKPLSLDPRVGLEYAYKNNVFARAGINGFQRALADGDTLNQKKVWIYQPSVGVGFRINSVYVDYAFTNLANQSSPLFTHVLSIKANIGRK